jgi:hypothetical protein
MRRHKTNRKVLDCDMKRHFQSLVGGKRLGIVLVFMACIDAWGGSRALSGLSVSVASHSIPRLAATCPRDSTDSIEIPWKQLFRPY